MTSEYTPDEDVVREFYVEGSYARGARPHEGADEFDRFIARIKAEALREAAEDEFFIADEDRPLYGYVILSDRADRIEKEGER